MAKLQVAFLLLLAFSVMFKVEGADLYRRLFGELRIITFSFVVISHYLHAFSFNSCMYKIILKPAFYAHLFCDLLGTGDLSLSFKLENKISLLSIDSDCYNEPGFDTMCEEFRDNCISANMGYTANRHFKTFTTVFCRRTCGMC